MPNRHSDKKRNVMQRFEFANSFINSWSKSRVRFVQTSWSFTLNFHLLQLHIFKVKDVYVFLIKVIYSESTLKTNIIFNSGGVFCYQKLMLYVKKIDSHHSVSLYTELDKSIRALDEKLLIKLRESRTTKLFKLCKRIQLALSCVNFLFYQSWIFFSKDFYFFTTILSSKIVKM